MQFMILLCLSCLALTGCFGLGDTDVGKGSDVQMVGQGEKTSDSNGEMNKKEKVSVTDKTNGTVQEQKVSSNVNSTPSNTPSSVSISQPIEPVREQPAETAKEQNGSGTISEGKIENKYKAQMLQMQSYYSGRLDSLYNGAVADVNQGKLSKQDIYSKYAGTANALKEESQAKVNQTLASMKEELKSNGYSTDSVDQLRSDYYAALDKAKDQAMAKVKNSIGF